MPNKHQRYIPIPVDMRHFDIKDYLNRGVQEPTDLSVWVENLVLKIDKYNEQEDLYDGIQEDLMNELIQFAAFSLRNVKYAMYREKGVVERMRGEISFLRRSLEVKKELQKPKKAKSKESEPSPDEIAKIMSLGEQMTQVHRSYPKMFGLQTD